MKRSYGSKCSTTSSSSSQIRSSESVPRICGCGETLLLLKATTQKNNGRFFWRCKNWAVSKKVILSVQGFDLG